MLERLELKSLSSETHSRRSLTRRNVTTAAMQHKTAWMSCTSSPSDLSEPRYATSLVWNSNDNAGGQNLDTNEALICACDAAKNCWSSRFKRLPQPAGATWPCGIPAARRCSSVSIQLSDLWEFDYDQEAWNELSPSGTSPSAREGHAAVWDQPATSMFIFGWHRWIF